MKTSPCTLPLHFHTAFSGRSSPPPSSLHHPQCSLAEKASSNRRFFFCIQTFQSFIKSEMTSVIIPQTNNKVTKRTISVGSCMYETTAPSSTFYWQCTHPHVTAMKWSLTDNSPRTKQYTDACLHGIAKSMKIQPKMQLSANVVALREMCMSGWY